MNVTEATRAHISADEWDAYLRLQVAKEAGQGISAAEDAFYRVCGSLERGLRVLTAINRLKRDTAVKPSVLTVVNPDEFFGRPVPAVHPQRSSGARRAGRTAATARHDRWQIGTLTLVTVTVCVFLLIETLRGVA